MHDIFRIRVKTRTGEIELEGTEGFVQSKLASLPGLITRMDTALAGLVPGKPGTGVAAKAVKQAGNSAGAPAKSRVRDPGKIIVPTSFRQWIAKFQENIRQADKLLIAAFFLQNRSPDNVFKSFLANQTLVSNGIELTSPETSLNRLMNEQLVVIARQAGKLTLYQVSVKGKRHLVELMGQVKT